METVDLDGFVVGANGVAGGRWVLPSALEVARPTRWGRRARVRVVSVACLASVFLMVSTFLWSAYSFERDCRRPFQAFLSAGADPGEARAHLDRALVCFEARGLTAGRLPSLLNSEGEDIGALYRSLRVVRLAFPSDPRQAGAAEAWLRTVQGASSLPDPDQVSLDRMLCLGDLTPLFQVWVAMTFALGAYLLFQPSKGSVRRDRRS